MTYSGPTAVTGYIISTSGRSSLIEWSRPMTAQGAYPAADLALYVPVVVPGACRLVKAYLGVTTAAGSADVGIYRTDGVKVVSSGLVATAGTTGQVIDITGTNISAGQYYFAVTATSTSLAITRNTSTAPYTAALGILSQQLATGAALPGTATFAVPQTTSYQPFIAFLTTAVPT